MKVGILRGFVLTASVLGLFACGSEPKAESPGERDMLRQQAMATLADFKTADPSLDSQLSRAYAYAVFPEIVSAAVGVGGAHGNGVVFQGGRVIGYADVSQATVGAQLGGQKYSELILFESQTPLLEFEQGTVEMDARATAVAAAKGAASTANYQKGVMVFSMAQGGLMAQAAIGGQKFRFRPVSAEMH